jgi:hypothetical protein
MQSILPAELYYWYHAPPARASEIGCAAGGGRLDMKQMVWIGCVAALMSGVWAPNAPARAAAADALFGGFSGLEIELRIRIDADGVRPAVLVVFGVRERSAGEPRDDVRAETSGESVAGEPTLGARVRRATVLLLGLRRAALAAGGMCHAALDGRARSPEE